MPKTKISDFSSTPASNTDINSINIAEGCAPSGINDAIRDLMAQLKNWQSGTSNEAYVIGSSGSLTLNQGTANGVPYLNGSKVLTSGSALVFDGTNLGLGVTPSAWTDFKLLQLPNGAHIASYTGGVNILDIGLNYYFNGSGYIYNTSDYAEQYVQRSGEHRWYNAPSGTAGNTITFTQAMTLDASGRLCIGVTSASERVHISTSTASSNAIAQFTNGTTGTGAGNGLYFGIDTSNDATMFNFYNSAIKFGTNATERARIDSSGNLLVNATSTVLGGQITNTFSATAKNGMVFNETSGTTGATFIYFAASGTAIGNVSRVGTTNAVIYNTTSDYRLKTVIGNVTGQGARIDSLKPIDYLWTEGGQQARGFLAHDFQTIYPNSVTGEKDAVDADGNPVYQSMQAATSEVIADLVAEIQSLRKRLAALEAK